MSSLLTEVSGLGKNLSYEAGTNLIHLRIKKA